MEESAMANEEKQPAEKDVKADQQAATPDGGAPMNRAERRALAHGKKGAGNAHTVNLPGGAPHISTRGAAGPPQQHTRSSNRGK
jgi:hypothetical protein